MSSAVRKALNIAWFQISCHFNVSSHLLYICGCVCVFVYFMPHMWHICSIIICSQLCQQAFQAVWKDFLAPSFFPSFPLLQTLRVDFILFLSDAYSSSLIIHISSLSVLPLLLFHLSIVLFLYFHLPRLPSAVRVYVFSLSPFPCPHLSSPSLLLFFPLYINSASLYSPD